MIWLLRHGHAADPEPGQSDAERPLTEKGEEQARVAGLALAKLGIPIDACLASPRVRARDTARLACEALGIEVELEPALAGGHFDPVLLAEGRGENVLLVGHEPDFSHAVQELTGAQVRMKKGGLAGCEPELLHVLMRPSELRAIAD
jgi:phosphohistidine phosphatase